MGVCAKESRVARFIEGTTRQHENGLRRICLFGTYQAEVELVHYGVTTGFVGHNPFVIQLAPLWKFLCGDWKREKEIDAMREHPSGSGREHSTLSAGPGQS